MNQGNNDNNKTFSRLNLNSLSHLLVIILAVLISINFISAGSGSFFISNKSNEGQEFFSIIGTTGRIGIGMSSPLSIFHLNASLSPGMIIESNSSQSGSVSPRLGLIDAFSVASSSSLVWYIDNYATDFRIFQKPNITAASSTESVALFIDSSTNNVGIGTSTPTSLLDVNGDVKVTGAVNHGPTNVPLSRWLPAGSNSTCFIGTIAPRAIAFDGTSMWITLFNVYSVMKVTPPCEITTYGGIGAATADAIAFDGANMWTTNGATASVTKITPTGVMTNYSGTGLGPGDIAFDGVNMWTVNLASSSVTKITPTGVMTNYSGLPSSGVGQKIAFDGTNMWVTSKAWNTVTKITPAGVMTNYSITGAGVDPEPTEIAFDGTNMWVTNTLPESVTKIAPDGVTMTTYGDNLINPQDIAFDGTNIWISLVNIGFAKVSPTGDITTYAIGLTSGDFAFDGTNMWLIRGSGSSYVVHKVLAIRG